MRTAADTGVFSNPTTSGFQEGYYPLPSELAQLFVASGFRFEDMLSLKSIANDLAPQVARLEPTVRADVERLARALCRRPEIIATCGHALLVAKKSARARMVEKLELSGEEVTIREPHPVGGCGPKR